jgi:hypothetical protein
MGGIHAQVRQGVHGRTRFAHVAAGKAGQPAWFRASIPKASQSRRHPSRAEQNTEPGCQCHAPAPMRAACLPVRSDISETIPCARFPG